MIKQKYLFLKFQTKTQKKKHILKEFFNIVLNKIDFNLGNLTFKEEINEISNKNDEEAIRN